MVLGVLGMFLPLLPTTPFLLLSAVCYARSSERLYERLLTNRFCGEYIRNYREGRGISLKQKAITIVLLWITMGSALWFAEIHLWIKFVLFAIAAGVTVYLLRMKTLEQ